MSEFLKKVLPRLDQSQWTLNENCVIRPHNGKADLVKKLRKAVQAYPHMKEKMYVLVLHDQDSNDCKALKATLTEICSTLPKEQFKVRIVCRELENWYMGDTYALDQVFGVTKFSKIKEEAIFRNTDSTHGKHTILQILGKNSYPMLGIARSIGEIIELDRNTSPSFQAFMNVFNGNCLIPPMKGSL